MKVPQPKVRERKDGAAIPLDDLDKRLMNLLQSNFRGGGGQRGGAGADTPPGRGAPPNQQ